MYNIKPVFNRFNIGKKDRLAFLLPTFRNQNNPEIVTYAINSINRFHTGHKIYVISETIVRGQNVEWVPEGPRNGPISALNRLARLVEADYYIGFVDDHELTGSVRETIDYIDNLTTKFRIGGLNLGGKCFLPGMNGRMGIYSMRQDLSYIPIVRFPVFRKDGLRRLDGYIFHPSFNYHAGDIYLSYYLAMHGHYPQDVGPQIRPTAPFKDSSHEIEDCNQAYKLIEEFEFGKPYSK